MKPYRTTQTETKICPICGRQSPITSKYCVECGYEIPEISFFPQNNNNQPQSDRKQNQQSQTIYHSPIPKKTRRYGWLIFFLALAALLIYTNPDEKMHLDFIRENIGNEITKNVPHLRGSLKNLSESSVEEEAINDYLSNNFKRTNYMFFSLTEIQVEEKWEPWAIGLFGNIIAFSSFTNQINSLFQQLKVIKYEGFIPEKHQELLELIRDEVAINLLKKSSSRIAELDEVLIRSRPKDLFFALGLNFSDEAQLYTKNLTSLSERIHLCIERNGQFILDFIDNSKGYGGFTGTVEDQHLLALILKYITKESIKSPMISKLVLVSQGPNYLVYQFFEINIPFIYYTVRFNFVDGKYSGYEFSNEATIFDKR